MNAYAHAHPASQLQLSLQAHFLQGHGSKQGPFVGTSTLVCRYNPMSGSHVQEVAEVALAGCGEKSLREDGRRLRWCDLTSTTTTTQTLTSSQRLKLICKSQFDITGFRLAAIIRNHPKNS